MDSPDIVATWAAATTLERPPLVVTEPLAGFLAAHGLGDARPIVAPIGEGRSNAVFALAVGDARYVLRRPPRPPIPPSAHDVLREARILRALHGRVPVPAVLATCADPDVIGAPFVVLEHMPGVALGAEPPAALRDHDDRRRVGEAFVDALADVHAVDWRAAGLGDLARSGSYLERQLRRFSALWESNRTRALPAVDRTASWLRARLPAEAAPALVHGDARLGNALFDLRDGPRLTALLDWEMATIGDPLADLGYLCATWVDPGDPPLAMFERSNAMRAPGFPRRAELVARYAERTGRSTQDLEWYRVLALWKTAIFMEGNFRRALAGGSDDPFVRSAGERVRELAAALERSVADR